MVTSRSSRSSSSDKAQNTTTASRPPRRPQRVPADAWWHEPWREWVQSGRDRQGEPHGPARSWSTEQKTHAELTFKHGVVDGVCKRFYANGELAAVGKWKDGVCHDVVCYRSEKDSTGFPLDAAENVWEARFYSLDGRVNATSRYFARNGTEVTAAGERLPKRPRGLPPGVRFISASQTWALGALRRGDHVPVGKWQWWSLEGRLVREEDHDDDGATRLIVMYREEDGSLESREEREGDRRRLQEDYRPSGDLRRRRRWNARGDETYSGTWTALGELEEEQEWLFDGKKLTSTRVRGPGGVLLVEIARAGRQDRYTFFHRSGKPRATGSGKGGRAVGTWRFFDEKGALEDEVDADSLRFTDLDPDYVHLLRDRARLEAYARQAPSPKELEGVDKIPWKRVRGCWGDEVRRFPALLSAVTSQDHGVRRLALETIFDECYHQGTLHEAAARVTPFLIRLLERSDVDHASILDILDLFGCAASPYQADAEAPPDHREAEEDGDWRLAILGTLGALSDGWPTISRLFTSSDAGVRRRAVPLAAFSQGRVGVQKAVLDLAQRDPDRFVRATAAYTLITSSSRAALKHLGFALDEDRLVGTVAAFSAAITLGPESPSQVVEVLAAALRDWRELSSLYEDLPFVSDHLLADLALGLGSVRSDAARALLPELCAALTEVDDESATSFGRGLLALALGIGTPPFAPRFVDAIATLARSDRFFSFKVDAAEVLRDWGLPTDPEGLDALAAALRAANDAEATLLGLIEQASADDHAGCCGCCHHAEHATEEDGLDT